ncbi:MAG: SPOR domain-containing protein [Pseudomonadota bacterium]
MKPKSPASNDSNVAGTEPDPLEELARIMREDSQAGAQQAAEDTSLFEGDPLGVGSSSDDLNIAFDSLALAEGDGSMPSSDDALSPEPFTHASLATDPLATDPVAGDPLANDPLSDDPFLLDPLNDERLLSLPPTGHVHGDADDLFADLDFGADTQDVSPAPELLNQSAPNQTPEVPVPHLSAHLTPRRDDMSPVMDNDTPQDIAPQSLVSSRVQPALSEDELVAAMGSIALDDPTAQISAGGFQAQAIPQAPPPIPEPVSQAPVPGFLRTDAHAFGQEDMQMDLHGQVSADMDHPTMDPTERPEAEQDGRSGLPKMLVFGLAGVAMLGLGGVFAFGLLSGQSPDQGPQLIVAEAVDDKVEPEGASTSQAQPGDAAFGALEGDVSATGDTPRVVLPLGEGDSIPLQSTQRLPSADTAPAAPGSTARREVRTVTVRADGTIVETSRPAEPETPAVELPRAPARIPAFEAASAPTVVETVPTTPVVTSSDPISSAQVPAVDVNAAPATSTPVPSPILAPTSQAVPPSGPAVEPTVQSLGLPQTQTPTQSPDPTPAATATVPSTTAPSSNAPIQLAQPAAAPQSVETAAVQPQAASPVPSGDFIVQLASLRSEDEARATFSRLQSRFGSILESFSPNIQRADLGDRGIFHRVRIGPMDRASADSLCSRYQSAGGDCFVQRQ